MCERYKQVLVRPNMILKDALKKMNVASMQLLIVVDDEDKLLGIVTDGDVRRAIIKGIDLQEPISSIMTLNPTTIYKLEDKTKALELMKKFDIKHIPVINKENKIIGLILWNDFLKNGKIIYPSKESFVIIMAGGKGSRLDPFTKILPKSLIPLGKNPIIQLIMDNFKKYGFNKFIISLNYRANMIKMYFSENPNESSIEYIQEKEYLGTAGSLYLAKDKLRNTFVVSNCDVIIDANIDSLLNYHENNKNHVTVLGINRHIKIPYGVLRMRNADLKEFEEKPEYHFIVNSGVYILEPELLDLIQENQAIDMPDLLILARKRKFKIQVYPVSCSWFDIGEWEEYKKAAEYLKEFSE